MTSRQCSDVIKRQFVRFDQSKSGYIERGALNDLLKMLAVAYQNKWTDSKVDKLLAQVETNAEGLIKYDEFLDFVFGNSFFPREEQEADELKLERERIRSESRAAIINMLAANQTEVKSEAQQADSGQDEKKEDADDELPSGAALPKSDRSLQEGAEQHLATEFWQRCCDEDGRRYFHQLDTGETIWEVPTGDNVIIENHSNLPKDLLCPDCNGAGCMFCGRTQVEDVEAQPNAEVADAVAFQPVEAPVFFQPVEAPVLTGATAPEFVGSAAQVQVMAPAVQVMAPPVQVMAPSEQVEDVEAQPNAEVADAVAFQPVEALVFFQPVEAPVLTGATAPEFVGSAAPVQVMAPAVQVMAPPLQVMASK